MVSITSITLLSLASMAMANPIPNAVVDAADVEKRGVKTVYEWGNYPTEIGQTTIALPYTQKQWGWTMSEDGKTQSVFDGHTFEVPHYTTVHWTSEIVKTNYQTQPVYSQVTYTKTKTVTE